MTGVKVSFRTWSASSLRRGFTLTELLLVIIIIAILAAMTMTVQRSAMQSTRRERTIATIRKIDAALTSAYEKYQYRKPDVSYFIGETEDLLSRSARGGEAFRAMAPSERRLTVYHWVLVRLRRPPWLEWNERSFYTVDGEQTIDNQFAPYILRTIMLRELLLCDFPDSLEEVSYEPLMNNSPVHLAYRKHYEQLEQTAANAPDGDISADLLYLVVMNTSPETRGTFLDRETADTNSNGIPEFIDGWGNPIRFIRWAPAVPESNRQPTLTEGIRVKRYRQLRRYDLAGLELSDSNGADYADDAFYSETAGSYPVSDYDFLTYFEDYYPGLLDISADPFDPMGSLNGWLLTPLIYSAGPDREYGLGISTYFNSPFEDAVEFKIGLGDWEGDGQGNTYSRDNITNHNLE